MNNLRDERGEVGGTIFARAAKDFIPPAVLPLGSVFIGIPVPDAKLRGFGGETQPRLGFRYRFPGLDHAVNIGEITNRALAAIGRWKPVHLPFLLPPRR